MKCVLVGSRFFGASVLGALLQEPGVEFIGVVAPAADDRLALAAVKAGLPLHLLADPKIVPPEAIAEGCELIVAAHTHARVSDGALLRSRLGGVGYHPSLLPRHRGIAAVEWTILQGDAIAGGSVYHLSEGWDAGAIAAQDWCFVGKGDTARELWERSLAPMGLALLAKVVRHAKEQGSLPAHSQDARYATKAPMIRRPALQGDAVAAAATILVAATVTGPDRPGIVGLLADRAKRHGASWAMSRMSSLGGEFAGIIHFEVPPAQADALAAALQGLEATGMRVLIARGGGAGERAQGVALEMAGEDRPGMLSQLAGILADRGVNVETLHTEVVTDGPSGQSTFRVGAHLRLPKSTTIEALRQELGALASQMMVDIALDDRPASTPAG